VNARLLPWIVLAVTIARPTLGICDDLDAPDPDEVTSSKAYDYENKYFSIRLGGGLLIDYATYLQDEDSELQMELHAESGIRDLRGLASGRLIWDPLTYTVGYMYDAQANKWRFRQTGLRIQIDELAGFLFLGRTKEGFSTNKFMVGYYGWFNERSAANDAFLPILADGVRWTATAFGGQLVYNAGVFSDAISEDETFSKNDWQVAARAVWLPLGTNTDDGVLHLALGGRYSGADDGLLQYRSKPESFLAQSQAVDTGMFDASTSAMVGFEAYYVRGPFSSGSEYYLNQVSSDATGDPFFHGGEIFAAYLVTGETHPYRPDDGIFDAVLPTQTFFSGGPGAWELAMRCTYVDLDSGLVEGGTFFRYTAQVNWYLTAALRLEAVYGYGVLDRFDLVGSTQFFQTRVQVQVK
jgi:phosphate-selective porin OprO/OprP